MQAYQFVEPGRHSDRVGPRVAFSFCPKLTPALSPGLCAPHLACPSALRYDRGEVRDRRAVKGKLADGRQEEGEKDRFDDFESGGFVQYQTLRGGHGRSKVLVTAIRPGSPDPT
ncbi:hypothetical protein NQZ68_014976 [Dissostichus eleginoides]|nr:hypothetical protein NQZ68_014976 [Dissostichus eleginoides]